MTSTPTNESKLANDVCTFQLTKQFTPFGYIFQKYHNKKLQRSFVKETSQHSLSFLHSVHSNGALFFYQLLFVFFHFFTQNWYLLLQLLQVVFKVGEHVDFLECTVDEILVFLGLFLSVIAIGWVLLFFSGMFLLFWFASRRGSIRVSVAWIIVCCFLWVSHSLEVNVGHFLVLFLGTIHGYS